MNGRVDDKTRRIVLDRIPSKHNNYFITNTYFRIAKTKHLRGAIGTVELAPGTPFDLAEHRAVIGDILAAIELERVQEGITWPPTGSPLDLALDRARRLLAR